MKALLIIEMDILEEDVSGAFQKAVEAARTLSLPSSARIHLAISKKAENVLKLLQAVERG